MSVWAEDGEGDVRWLSGQLGKIAAKPLAAALVSHRLIE
jgi:hypothetical protein